MGVDLLCAKRVNYNEIFCEDFSNMADLTPCARQTACNVNHTTSIVLKMQLYRYIRCFTSIRQARIVFCESNYR